jgi:hypothetical protein
VLTSPTFFSGFSTASSVTRKRVGNGQAAHVVLHQRIQHLRHLAAQAFAVAGAAARCAAFAVAADTADSSSKRTTVLIFIVISTMAPRFIAGT